MSQVEDTSGAPKRPRKTAALTIRMTQDTRDLLEAASRQEHRSVSEMAEIWLTAASRGEASYRERIGGAHIAETVEAMLQFKRQIEAEVGNPSAYLPARDALLAGWKLLVDRALPYTPDTPEGERFRTAQVNLRVLSRHFADTLLDDEEGADEEVAQFVFGRPTPAAGNVFAAGGGPTLYELARRLAERPTAADARALATRLGASVPAKLEAVVRELSAAVPPFLAAYETYMQPRLEALRKGEALAEAWQPPGVIDR